MVQRKFGALVKRSPEKDDFYDLRTPAEKAQLVIERLESRLKWNSYTDNSPSRAILAEWRRGPVPLLHIELNRLHGTESIALYPDEAFGLAKWLYELHGRLEEDTDN